MLLTSVLLLTNMLLPKSALLLKSVMLIATGKIVAPITRKAPAGESGQSYRYLLPDSVLAENGLNFDDDALLEQVDVCDFLFEVNLQLPFETTFNLTHAD